MAKKTYVFFKTVSSFDDAQNQRATHILYAEEEIAG
jgi:hypothetical protein